MKSTSISSRLKSFDVYRKLPSDLTEPTLSGALVSIVSVVIMVTLFLSEFSAFLAVNETSETYVDVSHGGDKIKVNLDVLFPNLPCDILSLDAQDIMGSHHVNLEGDLKKIRVDQEERELEVMQAFEDGHDHGGHDHAQQDGNLLERVVKSLREHEGCKIKGFIMVNKVPGNFHVSSHAFGGLMAPLQQQTGITNIDVSHRINHISFGDDADLKDIKRKFSEGVLNPIDGTQKIKPQNLQPIGVMHQYYISVVPTIYEDLSGKRYHVFQFTSNSNEIQTAHMAAVYFRYDLFPVTVRFTQSRQSIFHFLVEVCAIIGGVFTVAGIVDSIVHKSVMAILKKAEINKLN